MLTRSSSQNPAPYSPAVLTHEMAFAGPMVEGMKQHVAAIREDALQAAISKEALVEMVEGECLRLLSDA